MLILKMLKKRIDNNKKIIKTKQLLKRDNIDVNNIIEGKRTRNR